MKRACQSFLTLGLLLWRLVTSESTGDITTITVTADGWSSDMVVEGFETVAVYEFGGVR